MTQNETSMDLYDLDPATRALVTEAAVTGRRALFVRNGRPVGIILSYDEYLALRETIDLIATKTLNAEIEQGAAQIARGEMMLPEDLFVE